MARASIPSTVVRALSAILSTVKSSPFGNGMVATPAGKLVKLLSERSSDATSARPDMFDGSDPYCDVFWNNVKLGSTGVKTDTLSPVWNESFPLIVYPNQENTLRLEVYDYDDSPLDDEGDGERLTRQERHHVHLDGGRRDGAPGVRSPVDWQRHRPWRRRWCFRNGPRSVSSATAVSSWPATSWRRRCNMI